MKSAAILTIKSVAAEADHYVVTGLASTPHVDLVGDIVEPQGFEAIFPLPLLLEHDRTRPVGEVVHAQATADGVTFEARIPKVAEAGRVRDRVLEVIHSLAHGLLKGTSIGFSALESAPLPGGGRRYAKWRWLELSLVVIPCNRFAAVATVKSLERAQETLPTRTAGVHSVPLLQRQRD